MTISKTINLLNTLFGYSNYMLAKYSGVSQSTLSSLVRQYKYPTCYTLERLCTHGFGISMAEFYLFKERMEKIPDPDRFISNLLFDTSSNRAESARSYIRLLISNNPG